MISVPSFEERNTPPKSLGLPDPVLFVGSGAVLSGVMVIVIPVIFLKLCFALVAVSAIYYCFDVYRTYDDWTVRNAQSQGDQIKKMTTFSNFKKRIYADSFLYETRLDSHIIGLKNGGVSLCFSWDGSMNRYASDYEANQELKRRIGLLRNFGYVKGLAIEHHFIREDDASLADTYLARETELYPKGCPEIVKKIRQQLVDTYRPMAKTNRVMTVLSLHPASTGGLLGVFFKVFADVSGWKKNASALLGVYRSIEHEYAGARLLSCDEYMDTVSHLVNPMMPINFDFRYNLSEQLAVTKPSFNDGLLSIDGAYFKVMLVQNYQHTTAHDWVFGFSEADMNVHVSQIIMPKKTDDSINKRKKMADNELNTTSQSRGELQSYNKNAVTQSYLQYIIENKLSVADNAYIITLFGGDREKIEQRARDFIASVHTEGGLVRTDEDLQRVMFNVRLLGMGGASPFMREDHAEQLAVMFPFTVFSSGYAEPECLRLNNAQQLVGLAPSREEVPHELVVAQTNGGKDTQFGLKFIETYQQIRYDIIELGNSYQGAVEAVGGRYCTAKDQIISPLSSYEEFAAASKMATEKGTKTVLADFARIQQTNLLPIIKGINNVEGFSRAEEAVIGEAILNSYGSPAPNQQAPTLGNIFSSLESLTPDTQRQKDARDIVAEELYEFLQTPTGSCFKEDDQFIISPIANAIDFDKFEGDLMKYTLAFTCSRFVTNAMSQARRNQIVLNEYKVLLTKAPEAIKWVTLTIDRMGRKDWAGLTRITQGLQEIRSVDSEAINSIPNKTLLVRKDQHQEIGELLRMPPALIAEWMNFATPEEISARALRYRQGIVAENGQWHFLYLKFPELLLDLMNTRGEDKALRDVAYRQSQDAFERIDILKKLKKERHNAALV